MKRDLKYFFAGFISTLAAALLLNFLFSAKAHAAIGPSINGSYYLPGNTVTNGLLYVDSRLGNPTNGIPSNVINGQTVFCYPQFISNTFSVVTTITCMVPIPIQGIHHLSLQFTVQPITGSAGAIGATNCVWEVVRSVSGGPVSYVAGTNGTNFLPYGTVPNTRYDVLGYVTNVFANVSNESTAIATYSDVPRTVATSEQSTDPGIAGIPMLYILNVTIGATNGISNYWVTANGDP